MMMARELALSLKGRIERGGSYPADYAKAVIDSYLKSVLLRTTYPD